MCNHDGVEVSLEKAKRIPTPVMWGSPHSLVVWFGFPILRRCPVFESLPLSHRHFGNVRNSSIIRLILGSASVIVDHQSLLIPFFCFKFQTLRAVCIANYLLRLVTVKIWGQKNNGNLSVLYIYETDFKADSSLLRKKNYVVWCFQLSFSLG